MRAKEISLFTVLSLALLLCALPGCAAKRQPAGAVRGAGAADENDQAVETFDVLIVNGAVLDGGGGPLYEADVGIRGDKIAGIGDLEGARAPVVIDASGCFVTPGFIDVHSHADGELPEVPEAPNLVRQGITTFVGGNCGGSVYPVGEFFAALEANPAAVNCAILIGHNTVRAMVMGMEARAPTAGELEEMKRLIRAAMEEGAVGLSTGLKYAPGTWADTDEVVELSKVAAECGGVYATHMRDEGRGVVESVEETLEIGRRAGVQVQISHHKVASVDRWGDSEKTLRLVEEARLEGQAVYLDQYPYTATSTGLTVLFPPWSLEGGDEELERRLRDPQQRAGIKEGIVDNIIHDRGGNDPSRIRISRCKSRPEAEGKNLARILEAEGREASIEEAAELVMEIVAEGGAGAIFHCLSDEDLRAIMTFEATMIATDGHIVRFGEGAPHPRNYGAFPRVLRRYVREERLLELPEAVRKMTSLPARAFRLEGRGFVAMGMFADLVVLNAGEIEDTATWESPHQYPRGIKAVVVNGRVEFLDGMQLDVRAGRPLRRRVSLR